jgi:hypothetical protein
VSDKQIGVLLLCFDGPTAAVRARRPLDQRLRAQGDVILDSVVLRVNAQHKASVYDPRRVLAGAMTAALTWGLFAVVTGGGVRGLVIWAVLGAVYGGVFAYRTEHVLHKDQLARLSARLPAPSSALLTYVETSDPHRLLQSATSTSPTVASVAAIGADLTTRVFAGAANPVAVPAGAAEHALPRDQTPLLSMILLRYGDPATAKQVAARLAAGRGQAANAPQVELVSETDRSGRTHVADPTHGVAAQARSDMLSWGVPGLVVGAIVGVTGGGGLLSFLGSALLIGVVCGLFGLGAGALYGLWAGRAISARRLKRVAPLLAPGTSTLLAWAEGPVSHETIDTLSAPAAQHLVLGFTPVDGGAVLQAT